MKIAACLIVRNEAYDIAEWIAYHALTGFDAFLVYDNGSSDGTADTLKAAARVFDVRVVHWPDDTPRAQLAAYDHAIAANKREFDWIAFIDSDEFIVTHGPHSIRTLCETANAAAGIAINWAMFGTNGHVGMPKALLIEAFTRRGADDFPPNHHVKSVVRPMAVVGIYNPHAFQLQGDIISAAGQPILWRSEGAETTPGITKSAPDLSIAQVNHYFTRSREHWARKVARGYPNPVSRGKFQHFDYYDRNEVEDLSAQWNVQAVQACRGAIIGQRLPAKKATSPQQGARQRASTTGVPGYGCGRT